MKASKISFYLSKENYNFVGRATNSLGTGMLVLGSLSNANINSFIGSVCMSSLNLLSLLRVLEVNYTQDMLLLLKDNVPFIDKLNIFTFIQYPSDEENMFLPEKVQEYDYDILV